MDFVRLAGVMTYVFSGLTLGALYALLAMPLILIWATTDVVDLMVGGYCVISGVIAATVGGPGGIALGILAAGASGGLTALLFLVFHRLWDTRDNMRIVLSTFGLLTIAQAVLQARFGTQNHYFNAISGHFDIAGATVSKQGALNFAIAILILVLLFVVLRLTPAGLKMRAAAQSPISALLAGIEVRRIQAITFILGGLGAGLVGVLAATTTGVSYDRGMNFSTLGFSAVILFGTRGPGSAFAGGIAMGLAQTLGAAYLPNGWSAAVAPLVILIILSFGNFQTESAQATRA